MNYIKLGGMVLLACLIADTHAASPKPSGFLKDYSQLVEGEYLEAVWADMPAIQRSEAPEIMLGDIAMVGVSDGKDVSVTDCVSWLKRDILSGNIVSEQRDAPYRLELAITHLDPGSAAARILAGEFGAGHAQLQVEGRVLDVKNNHVVFRFAERRRSSGKIGLEDLDGKGAVHIFEHLAALVSSDVNNELLAAFIAR